MLKFFCGSLKYQQSVDKLTVSFKITDKNERSQSLLVV